MELLARSRSGLTLSQLSRYLELPKSSAFCLLRTLESEGYVHRDESEKYRISLRVCALAHMALSGIHLRDIARPYLRRLADSSGLTVHMAVFEQGACVLIEKISRPDLARFATWVGKHLSLHCTAIGKALGAHLPEEQLESLVREQGLIRHNDNTISSLRRLKAEFSVVRQRGYAVDDEEEEIGVRCIGAPIFNPQRRAVAAISLVATTQEIHAENLEPLARLLIAVANQISEQLANCGSDSAGTALTT